MQVELVRDLLTTHLDVGTVAGALDFNNFFVARYLVQQVLVDLGIQKLLEVFGETVNIFFLAHFLVEFLHFQISFFAEDEHRYSMVGLDIIKVGNEG